MATMKTDCNSRKESLFCKSQVRCRQMETATAATNLRDLSLCGKFVVCVRADLCQQRDQKDFGGVYCMAGDTKKSLAQMLER